MVQIRLVPVHLAERAWKELYTPLKSAMRYHPAMSVEDLLIALQYNQVAMFAALEDAELKGCFIVNVEEFPRRRVCNILVCAGRNGSTRGWIDKMLEEVESWASTRGCDLMAGIGRKGWMAAKDYGFNVETRAILTKEIDHDVGRRRNNGAKSGPMERSPAIPSEPLPGGGSDL